MAIEVELKFRLTEIAALERRLADLKAQRGETELQIDVYFAHPCRDFAATDEALRLRRVGDHNHVTYKGPKLDATTKTRREIELALPPGDQGHAESANLLESLGFSIVREVHKHRTHFTVPWQDKHIEVAIDDVVGLGIFVELEVLSEESAVNDARESLELLASHLSLTGRERRSYLELLLEARPAPA